METKALPPAKINTQKLLGGSSISSIVKSINQNSSNEGEKIFIIKNQVLDIEKILSTNVLLNKKELERKRKSKERDKFQKKEEKLENKKENGIVGGMNLPQVPNLGFLDRIKQFLFKLILGKIAITLLPHLPKLAGVVGIIDSIQNTLIDWGGKILNGLVSFVDKGYETYDKSRKLISDFGGNNLLKLFDGFNGAVGKIIDASIIAALAFGELGSGERGGSDGKPTPGKPPSNKAKPKPNVNIGTGGKKLRLPKGLKSKGGLLGLLFLIPDLIESGMLMSQGRGKDGLRTLLSSVSGLLAGIGAYSATIAGAAALGVTGVGLPAAIALAIAGFAASSLAGTAAFNLADSGLRKMGLVDKDPKTNRPYQYASGGRVTRGGKLDVGPKRSVEKSVKRQVKTTSTQLKPGSDVGGEKKVEKMFPKTDTNDGRSINPLGYIKNAYKIASGVNYFGPVFSLVLKKLSGDKIGKVDYDNVGSGLGAWMNNTFGSNRKVVSQFAGGGFVNPEVQLKSEDLTKIIAKSVEENVSDRLDKIVNDLEKQLLLRPKQVEKKESVDETSSDEGEFLGDATEMIGGAKLLMQAGFPALAASILSANIQAESGWRGQRTPWVLNDGAGTNKGLISWNRSRIINAERFLGKPLEKATNAEQIRWIKEELKQYGLLDDFMNPQATEQQLKDASYKYIRWGIEGERWSYFKRIYNAIQKGETGSYSPGMSSNSGTGGKIVPDARGTKLAGDLGDFMKAWGRVPGSIWQHSRHGGQGRRKYASFHNVDRAIDIGAYANEQGPILKKIEEFNRIRGIRPVQILHAGNDPSGKHNDHIHVAYREGGKVHGLTKAILGEEGPEFVIDADSTRALEKHYPGFLDALNKADYSGALEVIRNYASYESNATIYVDVDDNASGIVPVPVVMPSRSSLIPMPSNKQDYMASAFKR